MKIEYIDGIILKKLFIGAANSLEKNKEAVNALNVFPVPDGDTGTNMSLTMQSAIKQIKNLETNSIEKVASAAANGSLMGARGNSGVILSQLFRGFSRGLKDVKKIDTKVIAAAFKSGSDTAYKAVMKPIEGTILTVARECAEASFEIAKNEMDIVEFLKKVIKHGEETLQKTPEMLAVLKQAGVVDAGGKGLIVILSGALEALAGKEEFVLDDAAPINDNVFVDTGNNDDIQFAYCTEFIINNTNKDSESFRDELSKFGDSLLVVGGENIIKVHVHTNNPGDVLQKALNLGELIDIKIDNMKYQHRNNTEKSEEIKTQNKNEHGQETKKYSFITVAMGEGLESVFKDLKVDYVITGGQTMNPSTEDILKAIDSVTGDTIIILPNNSNIVLAATQAKELSQKNVEVLPTKTIPQGISALLAFDEELEVEDNIDNMSNAIKSVKTGQVTFSVRDTVIDNKEIKKDDIIGICDGEIKTVGQNVQEVVLDLIRNTADDDNELITIFYGKDIQENQAEELKNKIENEFEDFDVDMIYGGQPLYYYLVSIE
ncbi:DAK2 domain-containing protein [Brassicibacter mesophilus]|uniref:DAK2 domain-containing protein n=1 Tax=Brassicibacter mesophilus TaxID=745119 RepID=UPI003D1AA4F0